MRKVGEQMGIMRKSLSVSTLGLVDFWSDKERTARNTKGTKVEARKQTRLLKKQVQGSTAPAAQAPPAGWYADPQNPDVQRWWDGTTWTEHRISRQE